MLVLAIRIIVEIRHMLIGGLSVDFAKCDLETLAGRKQNFILLRRA
jgi:hypothetical protein